MKDGNTFIDIVAHYGDLSAPIAYEFRKSTVLAFEPNPHVCNLLLETKRINKLDNLLLDARAVSNEAKKIYIEGAEGVVLPSSQQILMSNSIDALLLELHVDLVEEFGLKAEEIVQLLQTAEFSLYQCNGIPVQPFPVNWREYLDGSNTIHILGLKQESTAVGRLPKIW